MNSKFPNYALTLTILIGAAAPAFAKARSSARQSRDNPAEHGKKRKQDPVVHPPVVFAVEGQTITVKTGYEARQYKVNSATAISLNGAKVPLSALKAGMRVSLQTGEDRITAKQITAATYRNSVPPSPIARKPAPGVAAPLAPRPPSS